MFNEPTKKGWWRALAREHHRSMSPTSCFSPHSKEERDEYEQGTTHARIFRSGTIARALDDPTSRRVPWGVSSTRLQTHQQWPARDSTWTLGTHSYDVITAMAERTGRDYTSLKLLVHSAEQNTSSSSCSQRSVSSGRLLNDSFHWINEMRVLIEERYGSRPGFRLSGHF